MWSHYGNVGDIDIGYGRLFAYWQGKDMGDKWNRPVIMLTRKSIHKMRDMSKDGILSFLYEQVKTAEHIDRDNRENYDDRFVPYKRGVKGYIYFMYAREKRLMKIGCSGSPQKRKASIAREIGCPVDIIATYTSEAMYEHEHEFHKLFQKRRKHGEWFNIGPKHMKIVDRFLSRGKYNESFI